MRLALVQPKIPDGNYFPSLGLLYIAALLEKDGFVVRIFDENHQPEFLESLITFQPRLVGITAVTASINGSLRLSKEVKERLGAVTVLGGPHPTALPRETIASPDVDYVVAGEGEYPMRDLARFVAGRAEAENPRDVRNLFFKDHDDIVATERAEFLTGEALDALPYPAFHLVDLNAVFGQATHGLFSRGKRALPIMTSRGCPNACTFCCRVMGFRFRERSVKSVLEEIRMMKDRYELDELYFEDDNFTNNKTRALAILKELEKAKLGISIKFANGLRADRVDEEILEQIKKSGGYWIGFGIESGSRNVLRLMKKNLDLDRAEKSVKLAKKYGFYVGSNCIIGYPGETKNDLKESLNFFLKLKLDSCAIVNLIPFPKTAVRALCEKEGYLTPAAADYDQYYFKIFSPNVLIATPEMSIREIRHYVRRFYFRFYSSPVKAFRLFKVVLRRSVLQRRPRVSGNEAS